VSLSLAFGSVPSIGRVTDDTAIYQNLSEIRAPKAAPVNFDADIDHLSMQERRYRENLPSHQARIQTPVNRITKKKYVPSKSVN